MKSKQKHLMLSERNLIEQGLNDKLSFSAIAANIGKDPTTISKEVRKHRTRKLRKHEMKYHRCVHEKTCNVTGLCDECRYYCKSCNMKTCYSLCSLFEPSECSRLQKPPYVCNGCPSLNSCKKSRWIYVAKFADDSYHEVLSSAREGINQLPEEMQQLDQLISPLIQKGQSISHIYSTHSQEIGCSRRTLYKYIDRCVFTARNIDLPRKVKYKPRKKHHHREKTSPSYRSGRSYQDFTTRLKENPNLSVVEMDTVEGQKGGKVLLTLLFRNCSLMLAILLKEKTQEEVCNALNLLANSIGIETFQKLFPIILTDNGTEFQNPGSIECDEFGEVKTSLYYCDPNCSWQKGMIEKNHVYIRYVIPKGVSLDGYHQEDITKMINHINGTARDSLNGCTPYQLSLLLLEQKLHKALSLQEIKPDEVILKPILLK